MSKKCIIAEVEIKIGENLYLRITDVSFIPSSPAIISGRPEDCYEAEPAECDWKNENARLAKKKKKLINLQDVLCGCAPIVQTTTSEFPVDDSFVYEYYQDIITAIEEMEE